MDRLVRVELHDDNDFNYVLGLINDEISLYGEAREVKKSISTDGVPLGKVEYAGLSREVDVTGCDEDGWRTIQGQSEITLAIRIEADISRIECNGQVFIRENK